MQGLLARAALAALALPLATGCISKRRPLVLDTTPPGAVVYVDGATSGHSTPCTIELLTDTRVIELRLAGYEPETRVLRPGSRSELVYWRDGVLSTQTWSFPMWLGLEDFLFPIKEDDGLMPARIHVRLRRASEPIGQRRDAGQDVADAVDALR